MQTHMDNVYLVPQKSTFEIQDFTYVYVVDSVGVAKVRSFQPLERVSAILCYTRFGAGHGDWFTRVSRVSRTG